ncbi:hypothetical protein GX408_11100 [bacterium]|nr:hypothetical protein [bacterium]
MKRILFYVFVMAATASLYAQTTFNLSGTVSDALTGKPIAGPEVVIYDSTWQVLERKEVGNFISKGQYLFTLPTGYYYIEVIGLVKTAQGINHLMADEFYARATSCSRATLVHLRHDTVIDFALKEGRSLSGTLYDQTTGMPIAGGAVAIYDSAGHPRGGRNGSAHTESSGTFLFTGLAAETCYLYASGYVMLQGNRYEQIYQPRFYPAAAAWQQGEALDLRQDSKSGLTFYLDEGESISGTIRRQNDNTPIHGAIIILLDDSFDRVAEALTDERGVYQFTALSPGRYYILASGMVDTGQGAVVQQYGSRYYPGFDRHEEAQAVELSNRSKTGIDLFLAEGLSISGTVRRKKDHQPVGGATIELLDAQFQRVASTFSDGSGLYQFIVVRPGAYYVFMPGLVWSPSGGDLLYIAQYYPGSPNRESAQQLDVQEGAISAIDFQAQQGSSISGTVRRESDNQPIARARIELRDSTFNMLWSVESDQQGNYQFMAIAAGRYYVYATGLIETQNGPVQEYTGEYHPGTADQAAAQTIDVDDTAVADIDFALTSSAGIQGYISDSAGGAAVNMTVVLCAAPSWAFLRQTTTDASGYYHFTSLAPGDYYVIATGWVWRDGGTVLLYPETVYPDAADRASARSLCVEQAGTVTADIRMLHGYIITGAVRRHDNDEPIEFSQVLLYDAQWMRIGETSTDNWGWYHFIAPAAGLYYIQFTGKVWADMGGHDDWQPVYGASYYPGVQDSTEAQSINLQDRVDRIDGFLKDLQVGVAERSRISLPMEAALLPGYPNPFNAQACIPIELPRAGQVTVQIHSVHGEVIRTLVSGRHGAGRTLWVWDGRDDQGSAVASGIYFVVMRYESSLQSRKMLLLR